MINKLQINLFSCSHRSYRFPFTIKMIDELIQIRNTDKIKLCIHCGVEMTEYWKRYFSTKLLPFEVMLHQYGDSNYLHRVGQAHKTDCKYSCKLDDDVLVSKHVWDYMIDNLHMITPKNPIISPILTNGMPSVELFIEDFLDADDLITAHSLLLQGVIPPNQWGCDYSKINTKLRSMKKWDGKEYWDFVKFADIKWDINNVPWFYGLCARGIHPSRFSAEYNMFISKKVCENKDKFFRKNEYSLETYDAPYFTNNIFISETKFWVDNMYLITDLYDEGQLNIRLLLDNSKILYVRNGFGIHMAYGMTDRGHEIEKEYINNL